MPPIPNRCENESGEKWHHDEAEGGCVAFDYLGCFGTDNVFDDAESCDAICGGGGGNATVAETGGVLRPRLGLDMDGVCDEVEEEDCKSSPAVKVDTSNYN